MMNCRKTLNVKRETIARFLAPMERIWILPSDVSRFTFHENRQSDRAAD
jgi:hypothetical protein